MLNFQAFFDHLKSARPRHTMLLKQRRLGVDFPVDTWTDQTRYSVLFVRYIVFTFILCSSCKLDTISWKHEKSYELETIRYFDSCNPWPGSLPTLHWREAGKYRMPPVVQLQCTGSIVFPCLLFSFPDLSEVALTGDMEVKLNLVTQENLKRIIIKFSDN